MSEPVGREDRNPLLDRPRDDESARRRFNPLLVPDVEANAVVSTRRGRRDRITRRLLAGADALALLITAPIAALLVRGADPAQFTLVILATLPIWIVLFNLYGLYERPTKRISHSSLDDLPHIFHALLVGGLATWFVVRALPGPEQLTLAESALFGVLAMTLMLSLRGLVSARILDVMGPERVLIVGDDPVIRPLIRVTERHPEIGLTAIGVVADSPQPSFDIPGLRPLGRLSDLERVIGAEQPDRVFICSSSLEPEAALEVIDASRQFSLKIGILPEALELFGPSVEIDELQGVAVLEASPPVLSRSSRALKRLFDLVVASTLLILGAPILLASAIAIKATSPGPVIFRQRRVGRGGRGFWLVKFRTMVPDAEQRRDELLAHSEDPNWLKLDKDPRITRVGQFLRRTSIDELPQLFNVVKGDMSIVGPRPLPDYEDAAVAGWGRGRLDLTPGITGLWQVLGRTLIPFEEMVKLDYVYVTNWSLWLDVKVLLKTLPVVFGGRGVN
jgi:exopolysaccharide biosynthesis polyprenyl glycosylphosphotransferase